MFFSQILILAILSMLYLPLILITAFPFSCFTSSPHENEKKTGTHFLPKFEEGSLHHIQSLLQGIDWFQARRGKSPDIAFSNFLRKDKAPYDAAFPVTQSKPQSKNYRQPWIKTDLFKGIRIKNSMYHLFVKREEPI